MPKSNIRDHRAYAEAIAQRLAGVAVPAAMKAPLATFKAAFAAFEAAAGEAFKAREERDVSLQDVASADDVLDPAVDALATALVGAGVTRRTEPFKGFSRFAPSKLQSLAYATEEQEVRKLVAAVLKKKPAAAVVKCCQACTRAADQVSARLRDLVKPSAAYTKSLAARDALLPELVKATSRLKKHAELAWDDEPATYKAIFAAADAVQAPRKRAAKRAKAAPKAAPAD